MDAKSKAIIQLSEAAGALALHAVAQHTREAMEKVYLLGFEAGRLEGIEEGRQGAAGLIAGLRQLLGQLEGDAIPAPFEPISAGYKTLSENGRQVVGRELVDLTTGEIVEVGDSLADNLAAARAGEFPRLAEIEEEIAGDQVAAASEKLLEDNPGINYPGYFPLDVPVGDCAICQGLGTVAGELYGEPCLVPCICEAGQRVEIVAGLKVDEGGELADQVIAGALSSVNEEAAEDFPEVAEPGAAADAFEEFAEAIATAEQEAAGGDQVEGPTAEGEFETFCFRLACVNHDTRAATGCKVLEYVAECEHRVGPLGVLCGNTTCASYDASKMTRCFAVADMAELGTIQPVTSCGKFKAIPADPFTPTFSEKLPTSSATATGDGVNYLCCASCNIADPDCSACNLIELEIEERKAAEKITAAPAELEKCGNGSCTATGRDAKQICLRVGHPDQPAKDCKSFVPLADCKHDPSKRYNDESGSLMCGVCGIMIQASRRAAAGGTSPEPKETAQPERELTPNEEKMKALQSNCKHPKPFIKVIPGRGEVCEVCDLVLTPESLPLPGIGDQGKEIADAGTYFAAGEELDQVEECDHLPESVRYEEDGKTLCGLCGAEVPAEIEEPPPVKECDHPADCRRPEPVHENGVKVGSLIKCGECGQVIARFDNERKPIPRELWPETGANLDASAIRKAGFRPSELKMIKAGFALIKYYREEKKLVKTCKDPALGWYPAGIFKTYAEAERKLEEELKDPKLVEVLPESGDCARKSEHKLKAAGFEFYRKEKGAEGVTPKIKQGSKNWGMHSKYKSDAELETAWKKLLTEDPLALEG